MNIFVLDEDVKLSAQYHNDKHCVKMILEQVQILCSVNHISGQNGVPYRLTHKNHPCCIWARKSLSNYKWLCRSTLELCKEYTYRYGKVHKSQQILEWCSKNEPKIEDVGLTAFAQAMPEQYRRVNAIEAYREYYKKEKQHLFKWTKREKPNWIK